MTPKQADKAIKSGKPITLHAPFYHETFTVIIVSRDRRYIMTRDGGRFDRSDVEIVKE